MQYPRESTLRAPFIVQKGFGWCCSGLGQSPQTTRAQLSEHRSKAQNETKLKSVQN
jgi:hypothetical protein